MIPWVLGYPPELSVLLGTSGKYPFSDLFCFLFYLHFITGIQSDVLGQFLIFFLCNITISNSLVHSDTFKVHFCTNWYIFGTKVTYFWYKNCTFLAFSEFLLPFLTSMYELKFRQDRQDGEFSVQEIVIL